MKTATPTKVSPLVWVKPVYAHEHLPLMTDMDVPSTLLLQTLYKACSMQRAAGTQAEAQFVAWLVNRLPVTLIDEAGNIHVDLRKSAMDTTMFTSHTDTAHHYGGANAIRIDRTDPKKTLWRADKGSCLGADDGAGIALMHHMISEGVPGYYVFFRAEEIGGVGSQWLSQNMPELMEEFEACVSFDRADYADVVTHQGGARCCSDVFADALAAALSTDRDWFLPDSGGVFTDSANMVDLIAECTNVSVGYKHQHGENEWQDVTFLTRLADQLVKVQWGSLPISRDPQAMGRGYVPTQYEGLPGDDYRDELMDALEDAQQGKYYLLRGLVAAHMLPERPEDALKHVDPSLLLPHHYADYAHALALYKQGDAEVLDELEAFLYTE